MQPLKNITIPITAGLGISVPFVKHLPDNKKMKKPLIGVTCNYDFRDEVGRVNGQGAIGQDWNFVAADYIRSLEWAGALPVVIPQFDDAANAVGF